MMPFCSTSLPIPNKVRNHPWMPKLTVAFPLMRLLKKKNYSLTCVSGSGLSFFFLIVLQGIVIIVCCINFTQRKDTKGFNITNNTTQLKYHDQSASGGFVIILLLFWDTFFPRLPVPTCKIAHSDCRLYHTSDLRRT